MDSIREMLQGTQQLVANLAHQIKEAKTTPAGSYSAQWDYEECDDYEHYDYEDAVDDARYLPM